MIAKNVWSKYMFFTKKISKTQKDVDISQQDMVFKFFNILVFFVYKNIF